MSDEVIGVDEAVAPDEYVQVEVTMTEDPPPGATVEIKKRGRPPKVEVVVPAGVTAYFFGKTGEIVAHFTPSPNGAGRMAARILANGLHFLEDGEYVIVPASKILLVTYPE